MRISLPVNLLAGLLLTGLLIGCQTTPQREAPETPPQTPTDERQTPETKQPSAEDQQPPERPPAFGDSGGSEAVAEPDQTEPHETDDSTDDETRPSEELASTEADSEASEADAESDQSETLPAGELASSEDDPGAGEAGAELDQSEDERDEALAQSRGAIGIPQQADNATNGDPSTVSGQAANDAGSDVVSAQSSDERFRQAMRRFDGRLARERFAADERDEPAGAGGGGAAGAGGGQADGDAGGALAGSSIPLDGGQDDGEREPAMTGRGGIGERNTHRPPPGTPDGRNDDIVARQLREAAESESDPALRERLWEEYRAYKNDQG